MTTLVESEDYASQSLPLAASTTNGKARQSALSLLGDSPHAPTSVVSYTSQGAALLVHDSTADVELVRQIKEAGLRCIVLLVKPGLTEVKLAEGPENVDLLTGTLLALNGHLGDFHAMLERPGSAVDAAKLVGLGGRGFDLVLDLTKDKAFGQDVPPLGYFAPTSEAELKEAMIELPQLIGEFEKPKFFNLDPSICAHTARGVIGCTRCLDVCPTQAIASGEESVSVDPYLCQGIGICTTVCPTGAITYAFPRVSDLLDDVRRVLHRYHDEQGAQPVLLFHDEERGKEWLGKSLDSLPDNVIPVQVENVASVGMDVWLSCLAYGAHHVLVLAMDDLATNIIESIEADMIVAQTILGAMGYPSNRIKLLQPIGVDHVGDLIPADPGKQVVSPAGFAAFNEKRTTLRLALDHFHAHAPKTRKMVALEPGSPFGRVKVDKRACTLCMSCAAVCPAAALTAGTGLPRLMFLEKNCVQCGLCETACPEDAVVIEARFNFDAEERDQPQVMYEEEPFNCIKCGKPFATQSMMLKMREKLKGHWMYQDSTQMGRLGMCDNCRIEDMYINSGGMNPYEKPDKPTGSEV